MDYLDRVPDVDVSWINNEFRKAEKEAYFNYMVESAKALVKGSKLYGFDIDIDNPSDVIAALYAMYLFSDQMVKEAKREINMICDDIE